MTTYRRGWEAGRDALGHAIADALDAMPEGTVTAELWRVLDAAYTGLTPPAQPFGGRHTGQHAAARQRDPQPSHDAVRRGIGWDSLRGVALRIHYEHRDARDEFGRLLGLNDWEVSQIAERLLDGGLRRDANWKRISELRTDYDPPLIEPLLRDGLPVTRPGQYPNRYRGVYRITDAGVAAFLDMKQGRLP
ncbi:hypothetical protein PBI_THONKO_50 [Mycobacterium phage Thonko]|uniref:Uncharacterized protein n=1 Tax=Mycobacterium phage Thonko TaxID=2282910 RepID=A0A346FC97_9CAUD|nr:hypothetical protein I5G57_gp050 [Mycobacterium phage Thonko]AXN53322.1 hypothetical protein PBI_THONKO_50 [Mycobacterium phage Thonko]